MSQKRTLQFCWTLCLLLLGALGIVFPSSIKAQVDQGAVTGVVEDGTGAVVAKAAVTLTDLDTGLVLKTVTGDGGVYTFSPVKIGNYSISASAAGFSTTTQAGLQVNVQQRLNVNLALKPGSIDQSVTVSSAPPQLQTEEASVGQVMDAKEINNTPLNGRNWVYIAHLSAGVTPSVGARGTGTGDFSANGQNAEQNNFVLDGVDNNTAVVDYLNGSSFVVRPPPDALAEFKIQTGDYSAEFGHSAGAVINASLKSGTNQIHGTAWEYVRNDIFDARNYFDTSVAKYRENQFGATLGLPILKNKLFFFGDVEANRIVQGVNDGYFSVPTAKMRTGDFSELLNPTLSGASGAIYLYQLSSAGGQTSTGATPTNGTSNPYVQSCNGQVNVLCSSQINSLAQKVLNLYPLPNTGAEGQTYNNYTSLVNATNNTWQWDARVDWNISSKDQAFVRYSYLNQAGYQPPPLGVIVDGGSYTSDGNNRNLGENFALSETHVFTDKLVNEFRFGYNYGHFFYTGASSDSDVSSSLGLGGIPYETGFGGIPNIELDGVNSLTTMGQPAYYPSQEYQNSYQILDNLTQQVKNHSIKVGYSFQRIRFDALQPPYARGYYDYSGAYTGIPGVQDSGYGAADFLQDAQYSSSISNILNTDDLRWAHSAYVQDDWKATPRLTVNIGVRYDYQTPILERHDNQASLFPETLAAGAGTGTFAMPISKESTTIPSGFLSALSSSNLSLVYSKNRYLVDPRKDNFAPRIGVAYSLDDRTVVRAGYGLFYGGFQALGLGNNMSQNYPFSFTANYGGNTSCYQGNCPTDGFTLANGFSSQIAAGLLNSAGTSLLTPIGADKDPKTTYSQEYNLSVERSLSNQMTATLSYVGTDGRHLPTSYNVNSPMEIVPSTSSAQSVRPFTNFSGANFISYRASSNYNSLQAKLEKRYSSGLSFLATYTFAHGLDNDILVLESNNASWYRNPLLIPISMEYANSPMDVRHRVTFNGNYELPFGQGRRFYNHAGVVNQAVGGWSTSLTFQAQTGNPISIGPNITVASGLGTANAIRLSDPFASGGSSPASNSTTCATKTKTVAHWFNPCAFGSPLPASDLTAATSNLATVLSYAGGTRSQTFGPGLDRVNMSFFKNFTTWREQRLQFRADVFNLLNTPAFGTPSTTNGPTGGEITSTRSLQSYTPDARFFQFSAKYTF
ncbi:TonB-dependent receptor [Silvibacterium dinghuense]|uniref:TonB-dependent receptor n=1 Tax=Silvibacterium dinghuense TaxID=1560006 RepID=A0A4Q1SAX4_9BACT|nr:carboxypeptidase regulatory-like domain-containing protein [Silvibacterium dinghuense]RXS94276.1 TonB-dependent receptor [Silvibacterium dinghuense]GGH17245.1 hypothetical protein GCM10011586_39660 [Silvibacterium dinghuense]